MKQNFENHLAETSLDPTHTVVVVRQIGRLIPEYAVFPASEVCRLSSAHYGSFVKLADGTYVNTDSNIVEMSSLLTSAGWHIMPIPGWGDEPSSDGRTASVNNKFTLLQSHAFNNCGIESHWFFAARHIEEIRLREGKYPQIKLAESEQGRFYTLAHSHQEILDAVNQAGFPFQKRDGCDDVFNPVKRQGMQRLPKEWGRTVLANFVSTVGFYESGYGSGAQINEKILLNSFKSVRILNDISAVFRDCATSIAKTWDELFKHYNENGINVVAQIPGQPLVMRATL